MSGVGRLIPHVMAASLALLLGLAVAATGEPGATILVLAAAALLVVGWIAVTSKARATAGTGDAWLNVSAGALVVGVALVTFNGLRVAPGLAAADVAFVAAAASVFLHNFITRRPTVVPSWLVLAGTLILVAGVLSAAVSLDFSSNLGPAVRFAIALTLTPIVIGALTDSGGRRRLVIGAWMLSAAINAAVGVSDAVGVTAIGTEFSLRDHAGRSNALTSHPNHLGLVCATAIPVLLWALGLRRQTLGLVNIGLGLLLGLLAAGILTSGSRAALLAAAAGVAVFGLLAARRTRAVLGPAVFLLIGAVASVSLIPSIDQADAPTIFERFGDDPGAQRSDTGRISAFAEANQAFGESPIVGEGFAEARTAHNIYLQLLQSGGLVAFVAFATFAVGSLRAGRALRLSPGLRDTERDLAAALTASLVVWLVAGLAQNAVYDRYLYVPLGLLLGMVADRTLRRGDPLRPNRSVDARTRLPS